MKTAEEILDKIMMKETGMVNYPEKEFILQAMKEYAAQEVAKNLHKPDVSGSLGFDEGYSKGYSDAQKEAAQEIREYYHPNDR